MANTKSTITPEELESEINPSGFTPVEQAKRTFLNRIHLFESQIQKAKAKIEQTYKALPASAAERKVFEGQFAKIKEIEQQLKVVEKAVSDKNVTTERLNQIEKDHQEIIDEFTKLLAQVEEKRMKAEIKAKENEKAAMDKKAKDVIDAHPEKYAGQLQKKRIDNLLAYLESRAAFATQTQTPHVETLEQLRKNTFEFYCQLLAYKNALTEKKKNAALSKDEETFLNKKSDEILRRLQALYVFNFAPGQTPERLYHFTTTAEMVDCKSDKEFQDLFMDMSGGASPNQSGSFNIQTKGLEGGFPLSDSTTELLNEHNARKTSLKVVSENRTSKSTYNFYGLQRLKEGTLTTSFCSPTGPVTMGYQYAFGKYSLEKIPDDVAIAFAVAHVANQIGANPSTFRTGNMRKNLTINLEGNFAAIAKRPETPLSSFKKLIRKEQDKPDPKEAKALLTAISLYAAYLNKYEEGFDISILDNTGCGVMNILSDDPRIDALAYRLGENPKKFLQQGDITKNIAEMDKEERKEAVSGRVRQSR